MYLFYYRWIQSSWRIWSLPRNTTRRQQNKCWVLNKAKNKKKTTNKQIWSVVTYVAWHIGITLYSVWSLPRNTTRRQLNKPTVSIAEAIHVPYRARQISKRHNSRKNTWKDTEVEIVLYYVNTNSYRKFDVNILQDDREKCRKLNLNKRKYLGCVIRWNAIKVTLDLNYVKTNSYTKLSSQYYKTGEESPEN